MPGGGRRGWGHDDGRRDQATFWNVLLNIFLLMCRTRKFEATLFKISKNFNIFFPYSPRNVLFMDSFWQKFTWTRSELCLNIQCMNFLKCIVGV